MTSKNPLDSGLGDANRVIPGEDEDPSATLEKTVDLKSATDEIEHSLEQLSHSIEDTISNSVANITKEKEPPHFTLATSHTRKTTHKDDN